MSIVTSLVTTLGVTYPTFQSLVLDVARQVWNTRSLQWLIWMEWFALRLGSLKLHDVFAKSALFLSTSCQLFVGHRIACVYVWRSVRISVASRAYVRVCFTLRRWGWKLAHAWRMPLIIMSHVSLSLSLSIYCLCKHVFDEQPTTKTYTW